MPVAFVHNSPLSAPQAREKGRQILFTPTSGMLTVNHLILTEKSEWHAIRAILDD
jgi:hypothetical protein